MRILLVEDGQDLAGAVQTVLQRQGHVVDHCGDGLEGWTLLGSALARYELAIVDWMLPGLSGLELCRRARAAGHDLPMLLLTARGETADRVEGLDAGADDYLIKPFAMEELLARVRALQRRQPSYRDPVLEVGPYRFDPQRGLLEIRRSADVVAIPLAGKERQLMAYFLAHPQRIIPGSELRNQLWDLQQDPVSNVVAAQVRLLRRKLAAHGVPSPIETVPSRGYCFHPQRLGAP
ncbi:MAG: two-component system response regulator RppA [Cyanobacteriota bacterium]|nr:two-component system response regulator RppA [Cyanobacteriota bacterium]